MSSKTQGINVRVTPAEKEKLSESAMYCGLSLSEYLRRLGLGKNVKAATDEKIYKTFRQVRQLKKDLESLEKSEILYRLSVIEDLLKHEKWSLGFGLRYRSEQTVCTPKQ